LFENINVDDWTERFHVLGRWN